jgi:hypothetical protein
MPIPHYLPLEKRRYYRPPTPVVTARSSTSTVWLVLPLFALSVANLTMSAALFAFVASHGG